MSEDLISREALFGELSSLRIELNGILHYPESEIERYMVRHKELDEEELEWQSNAVNGR